MSRNDCRLFRQHEFGQFSGHERFLDQIFQSIVFARLNGVEQIVYFR